MVNLAIYIVATVIVVLAAFVALIVAISVAGALIQAFFACVLAFAQAVNWVATIAWRLVAWPFRTIYRLIARKVTHHAR